MKGALVCRDNSRLSVLHGPVIAALGSFDGVHLGHQSLIQRMNEVKNSIARYGKGTLVVISFYPHPATVVRGVTHVPLLTTLRQKSEVLGALGVTLVYAQHFTCAYSKRTADEFIDEVLIKTLDVRYIVLGPDARVGFERKGDAKYIINGMEARGRGGEVLPFLELEHKKVSSGLVRECLLRGDVEAGKKLLGRYFELSGRVVTGEGRGRTIGVPTTNLKTSPVSIIPAFGVYATFAVIEGKEFKSVTNVGMRPTFNGKSPSVETHLLDSPSLSLVGIPLRIKFIKRLRDEIKFSDAKALVDQIKSDIEIAKAVLETST